MKGNKLHEFFIRMKNRFRVYALHPRRLYRRVVYKEIPVEAFINSKPLIQPAYTEKKEALVSVVIPIYDRTLELKESIDSILNQTYENIELILVCDGSPHATLEIVEEYRKNPKVKIFKYNNNSGNAVRGRNKAIKEASGVYLAFQDSDDIAEPSRIEKSLQYIEEYDADIVYGGWRAKVNGTRDVGLVDGQEVYSPDCDYKFLKEICVPCQSTVMVKLDALRDVGGLKTKMRYREDHELWLRLAYFGYKFKAIPEILTSLRIHENNLELKFKDDDAHWQELTMSEHSKKSDLPPKIGYVIAGCDISGGLSVACTHANYLLENGCDVSFICTGVKHNIEWYPNQRVEIYNLSEITDNYDILIATYWMTAFQVEKMHAKRKIYFVQSDERKFYPENSVEAEQVHKTYMLPFEYITMAQWIKDWLNEEFCKDAFLVHNGIDDALFYKDKPLSEKTDRLRVLIEGPMTIPFKGVKEAFSILQDLDCEIWYVSSDGKPDPSWRCNRFFEKVNLNQMRGIYSSCDILLKLSKVESFCLPALEMMACGGIPVVAKVNGVNEFLVNGYNGFIVQQGDLQTAKICVKNLIQDKELRKTMALNASETAEKWYWKNTLKDLPRFLTS